MKNILILLVLFGILSGCSQSSNQNKHSSGNIENIPMIDIDGAFMDINTTPLKCSEFIEDIEYIQLETNNESVLGGRNGVLIFASPEFMYYDLKKFGLTDGKFIHSVGKIGRGPGEYLLALGAATDIHDNRVFVLENWNRRILVYDNDNNFIKDIDVQQEISDINYLGDNNIILFRGSFLDLQSGTAPIEYQIYNLTEERIINQREMRGIIKALHGTEKIPNVFGMGTNCNWYFENKLQYFESFTDTIFSIGKDGKITPRFFVNRKNNKPPLSVMIDTKSFEKNRSKYIEISSIFETPRYLFIRFFIDERGSFIASFDKVNQDTQVHQSDQAFENDISFMRIISPKNMPGTSSAVQCSFNSPKTRNEFISLMESLPPTEWTEPAKRLYNLVKKANPEDNGIVCIYKFKK